MLAKEEKANSLFNCKKVLIVDDDDCLKPIIARTLARIDPNMKFNWASSIEEANLYLENGHYDLIIADFYLANCVTSKDFIHDCALRYRGTPVIVMSGISLEQFFNEFGNRHNLPPLLSKPFQVQECFNVLKSTFDRFRSNIAA